MSAGSISSWRVSSSMAWAHGVQTDQAWPRFRAFSAMTLRQRRHRRRRPAVRSSSSSASRTMRGSAAALVDGSGPDMAVNSITDPLTMTRLRSDVPGFRNGFCLQLSVPLVAHLPRQKDPKKLLDVAMKQAILRTDTSTSSPARW